jgi:hypothetical protein
MDSPTGIIPEALMYPQFKKEVIDFLITQPLPSWRKVSLLSGWCITVGVRCKSYEYHVLEVSGADKTILLGA